MGSITVKPQVQAVYPDGLQDSFIIRNSGPYTVYVDNDASVNDLSLAIPATGTMAWDAGRPLFVTLNPALDAASASTISMVRNSQPAVFNNAIDNLLYQNVFRVTGITTPIVECSAYESIQLRISSAVAQLTELNPTPGAWYTVLVRWYDSTLNVIGDTDLTLSPPWGNTTGNPAEVFARANIPIQGSYFNVIINNPTGGGAVHNLRIVGTTRKLNPGMAFGRSDARTWSMQTFDSMVSAVYTRSVYLDVPSNLASYSILIPNLGPRLHITSRGLTAGTANGLFVLFNAFRTEEYYANFMNITQDIQDFDILLPLYEPIRLDFAPRTNGGVPVRTAINLRWFDQ